MRRLLNEKFSDFQKRRGKSKGEGWLKAIEQLCRAQHSLANEVREMRCRALAARRSSPPCRACEPQCNVIVQC